MLTQSEALSVLHGRAPFRCLLCSKCALQPRGVYLGSCRAELLAGMPVEELEYALVLMHPANHYGWLDRDSWLIQQPPMPSQFVCWCCMLYAIPTE